MNFKNIDLGMNSQFPSKYQVVNREETRRKYFEDLLNKIVQIYLEKITNETNRRLFSTLYVFLTSGIKKTKDKSQKMTKGQRIEAIEREMANACPKRKDSSDIDDEYEGVFPDVQEKLKTHLKVENEGVKGLKSTSADNYSVKTQEIRKRSFNQGEIIGEEGKQRAFNAAEFFIKF